MKYSILMPYYNRANQLHNTLVSFTRYKRTDYEIIIIEDKKNTEHGRRELRDVIFKFKSVFIFKGDDKPNPSTAFNTGAAVACGKMLIITNPECFHDTDILSMLDKEDPNAYLICSCKSIVNVFPKRISKSDELTYSFEKWYQHSKHNPRDFHFCTAISKDNYFKVGGFDERYSNGVAYDDIAFRDSVKAAGIKFIHLDYAITLHQYHPRERSLERTALIQRNKKIYES